MAVQIDVAGLRRAAASSDMRAAVNAAARTVAANARAQNVGVEAETGDPDEISLPVTQTPIDGPNGEAAALVSLAHPAGRAVQAKHGTLTKAAAAAGLRIIDRGSL